MIECSPFFSIIIPTYNSEATIQVCIESVLNQSFADFEVLVLDGLSSDFTLSHLNNYDDTRIQIYSEPDKGIYDAMNKGIVKSKGKWLFFLGSDDSLYDDSVLQRVFSEVVDTKLDVIYGNVLMIPSGKIYDGEFTYEKMQITTLCHQAIFYKRKVFDDFGLYNIKYKVLADHDMNMNWFFSHKHYSKYVNIIISRYSEAGFSSYYKDIEFEKDFNKKLFGLSMSKYSAIKLKELALDIALVEKRNDNHLSYTHYYVWYLYFRAIDLIKRKFIK